MPSTKQVWFAFQLVTVRTPSGKESLYAWRGEVGLTNWISKLRSNQYFDEVKFTTKIWYCILFCKCFTVYEGWVGEELYMMFIVSQYLGLYSVKCLRLSIMLPISLASSMFSEPSCVVHMEYRHTWWKCLVIYKRCQGLLAINGYSGMLVWCLVCVHLKNWLVGFLVKSVFVVLLPGPP